MKRELVYSIRQALRLRWENPEQRRRNGSSINYFLPGTKAEAMRWVRLHITLPRGTKAEVESLVLALSPYRPVNRSLQDRRRAFIQARYTDEIALRGGETRIVGDNTVHHLALNDEQGGLFLLRAEGWRYYSRREGSHRAVLAYLCGRDDNGRWAVRVPGTCRSVEEALEKIEPPTVRQAREAGRTVLRQGDVYVVETTKAHDGKGELPSNHRWCPQSRELRHLDAQSPHATLTVPFHCRFVPQKALRMGRLNTGARTGRGD